MAKLTRRSVLRGALLAAAGGVTALAGADQVKHWCGWDKPPVSGGYASAADNLSVITNGGVQIHYFARTTEKLVALTFDDGPAPQWTPKFLDALDEAGVPATFFLVGKNLEKHADLVRGRLDRHEVGNHSWSHTDLATLDLAKVRDELQRTHEAIGKYTGRTPKLLRPPFGHLGGSTVLAADTMGYEIALWSHAMHEHRYAKDPAAQAKDIVDTVKPGSVILAHDAGDSRRLVTLHALPAMITGLQERGYRFVTASELFAAASTAT
ncbi:MAG: polysaccharide deacetylase family protein [Actinoplanes sp.]